MQIYTAMVGSSESFTFGDWPTAQKHWKMRMEVIYAMKRMDTGGIIYRYGGSQPPSPGEKWRLGGYKCPKWFISNQGIPPSEAIAALEMGTSYGECRGAAHACVLIGCWKALGSHAFDTVHLDLWFPPGTIQLGGNQASPNDGLPGPTETKNVDAVGVSATLIPGDWVYMRNKEDYYGGYFAGENCIYVGSDPSGTALYYGLGTTNRGVRLPDCAVTDMELRAWLAEGYNGDMDPRLYPAIGGTDLGIIWTKHWRPKLGN